eukprot:scaffold2223_cov152-Skeletonema_marinoi.AAC.3
MSRRTADALLMLLCRKAEHPFAAARASSIFQIEIIIIVLSYAPCKEPTSSIGMIVDATAYCCINFLLTDDRMIREQNDMMMMK